MTKGRRIKIVFLIIIAAMVLVILFIALYNNVFRPFAGFDKNVLTNYKENEKIDYEEYFEEFFIDFVNYKQYEEEYTTDFYYNYRDLLCPVIYTMLFRGTEVDEGYSYIVKPKDEYETLKNQLLDTLPFVKTPIGHRSGEDVYYIESITVGSWVFKEIYFNYDEFEPSYFEEITRCPACWLAYNDSEKEITFSYFYECSLGFYTDEQCLREFIIESLYT